MLTFWVTPFRPPVCVGTWKKVLPMIKMPTPRDLKQVCALLGGVAYYCKFLRVLSKWIGPITSLLRKGVKFEFTPAMEVFVRQLLDELAAPPILVLPDWNALADGSVLRGVHRRFWCCARTGADGRLSVNHRLHQPRYSRFGEAPDSARLRSWQHCLGRLNAFESTPGARRFALFWTTRRSKAAEKCETTMRESSGGSSFSPRSTTPRSTARAAPMEMPIACPV